LLLDSLDGVLSCPLSGGSLVTRTVSLVDMCDLGNERVVRVGVGQHGADGKQDCGVVLVTEGIRKYFLPSVVLRQLDRRIRCSIPFEMVRAGLH
jgi:hypothetical protein